MAARSAAAAAAADPSARPAPSPEASSPLPPALQATASFAAPGPAAEAEDPFNSEELHEGDGTAFSERVNNTGTQFACSMRYLNDWASVHFAAVNLEQWEGGSACGR